MVHIQIEAFWNYFSVFRATAIKRLLRSYLGCITLLGCCLIDGLTGWRNRIVFAVFLC